MNKIFFSKYEIIATYYSQMRTELLSIMRKMGIAEVECLGHVSW